MKINILYITLFYLVFGIFNLTKTICTNNERCDFHGGNIRRPSLVNDALYLNPCCYKTKNYEPCSAQTTYILIYKKKKKGEKRKGSNE